MHEQVAGALLGFGDAEGHAVAGDHAGVADLAAGLRIERRLVEDEGARLTGLQLGNLSAVLDQCTDHAFGRLGLITEEFRSA